jgi:hypothetical protein
VSPQARLLFDENFGEPHIKRLAEFVQIQQEIERPVVSHLFELFERGTLDEDWLPKAADGGWTIITADRGRRSKKKGAPLPHVCAQLRITHVMMSGAVHSLKMFEKMRAILSVWPDLLLAAQGEKGRRYLLESTGGGRFRLSQRDIPVEPIKPPPGELFT